MLKVLGNFGKILKKILRIIIYYFYEFKTVSLDGDPNLGSVI